MEHRHITEELPQSFPQHRRGAASAQVLQNDVCVNHQLGNTHRSRPTSLLCLRTPSDNRNLMACSLGSSWTVAIRSISSSVTPRLLNDRLMESVVRQTCTAPRFFHHAPAMLAGSAILPDPSIRASNSALKRFSSFTQYLRGAPPGRRVLCMSGISECSCILHERGTPRPKNSSSCEDIISITFPDSCHSVVRRSRRESSYPRGASQA